MTGPYRIEIAPQQQLRQPATRSTAAAPGTFQGRTFADMLASKTGATPAPSAGTLAATAADTAATTSGSTVSGGTTSTSGSTIAAATAAANQTQTGADGESTTTNGVTVTPVGTGSSATTASSGSFSGAGETENNRSLLGASPGAFQHRGKWFIENEKGEIRQATEDEARADGVRLQEDRIGVFKAEGGKYMYRNASGKTAEVPDYDPKQAGFIKRGDGTWAFRNAWGEIATTRPDGSPIQPPRWARRFSSESADLG